MKRALLLLTMPLLLIVSACAGKHYTKMQGDEVTFYFKDKKAQEVFFASSRDNYKLHAARENKHHLWKIAVPAEQGFAYFYVVDGVITQPDCPYTENDDFGSRNCIYMADM